MLTSRSGAEKLAAALYSPACPFLEYNDVTIGKCAWATRVALVFSSLLDAEQNIFSACAVHAHEAECLKGMIAIHRAVPEKMITFDKEYRQHSHESELAKAANEIKGQQ
jgi:hypothetical protein